MANARRRSPLSRKKSWATSSPLVASATASTTGRISNEMAMATTASLKLTKRSKPRSVRASGSAGIGPMMAERCVTKRSRAPRRAAGTLRSVTRVLSCIQPTGDVHLGNYLGALRNWVDGQHEHDAFHGIVDLHALTVTQEPGVIGQRTTSWRRCCSPSGSIPTSPPCSSRATCRAQPIGVGDGVHGLVRRADPHGPVQGQVGQAGVRLRRPVHVPGAPGRRHPAVRRRSGARRRRPAPARRDHPRHRPALQPPLRRDVRRARGGDTHGRGAGHGRLEPDGEDVEVGATPAPG